MNYLFPPFFYSHSSSPSLLWWLLTPLLLWHIIWKGLALWKAAGNKQKNWFIALLIINTAGILEILYLVFFQVNPDPAKLQRSGANRILSKSHRQTGQSK